MRSAPSPIAPVAVADIPTSGGEPWHAELWLRRTGVGGLLIERGELLAVLTIEPEAVARAGGPQHIRDLVEPTRRTMQRGAWVKGFREGWVVEVDVTRGYRRRLWAGGIEA